jgi:magnesium-transporting ATPase (P-type)
LIPPNDENPGWTILGDPTEAALRVAAQKGGIDLEAEALLMPRIRELPFDSRRKRMSTIHTDKDSQVVYDKGAPKEVLSLCTHVCQDGQVLPLDDSLRSRIMAANDDYARNGLRVLAVASRKLPKISQSESVPMEYPPESIESDLTFLGLMAMMDPPRPEVARRFRSVIAPVFALL